MKGTEKGREGKREEEWRHVDNELCKGGERFKSAEKGMQTRRGNIKRQK